MGLVLVIVALACLFGGKFKLKGSEFNPATAYLTLAAELANQSGEIEKLSEKHGPAVNAWGQLLTYRAILRWDLRSICSARGVEKCRSNELLGFDEGISLNSDVLAQDNLVGRLQSIRKVTYYAEWLVPLPGYSVPDAAEVADVLKDAPRVIDALEKLKAKFTGR